VVHSLARFVGAVGTAICAVGVRANAVGPDLIGHYVMVVA